MLLQKKVDQRKKVQMTPSPGKNDRDQSLSLKRFLFGGFLGGKAIFTRGLDFKNRGFEAVFHHFMDNIGSTCSSQLKIGWILFGSDGVCVSIAADQNLDIINL